MFEVIQILSFNPKYMLTTEPHYLVFLYTSPNYSPLIPGFLLNYPYASYTIGYDVSSVFGHLMNIITLVESYHTHNLKHK